MARAMCELAHDSLLTIPGCRPFATTQPYVHAVSPVAIPEPAARIEGVPAQDDARENQMVWMFNLSVPPDRGRSDIDAYLDLEGHPEPIPFELKSATSDSVSTVRDFGPEHIAKWAHLHWLFAFYEADATTLRHCYYASPADMAAWIADKQQYVRPDEVLAQRVPQRITDEDLTEVMGPEADFSISDAKRIMKKQWKAAQYRERADLPNQRYSRSAMLEVLRERCGYVIRRGATLNNPHIAESYLIDQGLQPITKDHAARLRELVREYLANRAEQLKEGAVPAEDVVDPVILDQAAKAADTDDASA
ncbi:hypothetical protein Mkiyose1665_33230 [Mycobacterium kiyosense]|uniref:Uncharacterized protein n=1 Tax=Mycobacterium kiyosense TaxID=2871094 RepID=A0A9P3UZW9_9MYCO|nr:hypothetical protein MKCMC460_42620 [Mycobacterium sp. 20KCMC460]GLB90173.1 hypothetical protein SRL2020130_29900 [Mycobacterium kiyosense]GLB95762.1 hypothetical protein SRL2020226_25380 [Mycobacterium kiyosense]GLC02598.1 hypothetical protein SRL2020400_31890 [Mycobacterium kiyosense]GLC08533.1 hypothetical protein SRL2020411_31790 [Mycobacterium kiyosense]